MKIKALLILAAFLCLSIASFGQAARYDSFAQSTTTIGAKTGVLVTVPGAQVALCTYPAATFGACTKVPLCTDSTMSSCSTGSNPVTADSSGNFGWWVAPGQYDYWVTANAANTGPFHVMLPAGAHGVQHPEEITGTDMGDQINTAYANLPSSGGEIYIPASASCYQFSTPIVLSTNNKPVRLRGAGAMSTCLQFTASSGTALTMDAYNGNGIGSSAEDLELKTTVSASTATGLSVGPTNKCSHCKINRLYINGFQVETVVQTYGAEFNGVAFGACSTAANTIAFETTSANSNAADDNRIKGGEMQGCNTLISNGSVNPLWVDGTILGNALGVSAIWVSNTGAFHCTNCHFFNQSSGPVANWFSNGSGAVSYYNLSVFEDAKTTGTPTSFATVSGGVLIASNNNFSSAGETVTEAILFSGSGQGFLSGNTVSNSTFIPLIFNPSASANVCNFSLLTNLAQAGSCNFDAIISSTTNPASAGLLRFAKTDAMNFRNNANGADINGVSLNASDQVVVGGAAGVILTGSASSAIHTTPSGNGNGYKLNGTQFAFNNTPTISSGFGTSPSIVNPNGTVAFQINVGTGGTATSGIIGLPTAAHGWACNFSDITTSGATVFVTRQLGSSTTTATIANFNTAGAQAAWVASDILTGGCTAF